MGKSRLRRASGGSKRPSKCAPQMIKPRTGATSHLRQLFFAQAAEFAVRYDIRYERVLEHLWVARGYVHRLPVRTVAHLDDLVHAAACLDGLSLAWADLIDVAEPALVRVCMRRLDSADSVVFVRRMLCELRTPVPNPRPRKHLTLQAYTGVQPLRNWLAERTAARLGQAAVEAVQNRRPINRRLRLRGVGHAVGFGPESQPPRLDTAE